jgi:hypothetical protein
MLVQDMDRPSDSPYIERVWQYHSEGSGILAGRLGLAGAEC